MPMDMRTWIDDLKQAGELLEIRRGVDPATEMGALLYQSREKALLFHELTGFPGWRALGQAPANVRHAALAFGTTLEQLVPTVAKVMGGRISPQMEATGPVKEIMKQGDQVDIQQLPAHLAGARDGGRFIAAGLCVTKDPDTGRRNVSFHRLQIKGRNRTGMLLVPRHTFANFQKYEAMGKDMPVAVFIGHHPLMYMAAATTVPYGVDEFEVAGAYMGGPVRLVKAETVDLEVPFDAEVVLEGRVLAGQREAEWPFSEFQDYYVAGTGNNPVIEFQAMSMRHDAIFKNIQNGAEVEGCVYHKVPMSAALYRRIASVGGYVDLKNVMVLPGIFGVVVQMTPRYHGEAKNVLMAALSSEYHHPKVAIAVDEDVNIFNHTDLLWALTTRVNPQEDIVVIPGVRSHSMDPTAREFGEPGQITWQRFGSKVLIDATKPPTCAPQDRDGFERILPLGHGNIRLEDYLVEAVASKSMSR